MKWFRNLKIAKKLMLGFGLLAALTAFIGYQGIHEMGIIHDLMIDLYEKHAKGITHLKEANIDLIKISRATPFWTRTKPILTGA
jgi:methyl-accepting chemotaxis protein